MVAAVLVAVAGFEATAAAFETAGFGAAAVEMGAGFAALFAGGFVAAAVAFVAVEAAPPFRRATDCSSTMLRLDLISTPRARSFAATSLVGRPRLLASSWTLIPI